MPCAIASGGNLWSIFIIVPEEDPNRFLPSTADIDDAAPLNSDVKVPIAFAASSDGLCLTLPLESIDVDELPKGVVLDWASETSDVIKYR
jgi:hypothetical protein